MIRTMLVDDQELLRTGIRMVLDAEADISVVAEAADGVEALAEAGRAHPDVILMDVRMPHMDGLEATRRIVAESPGARVIVLTTFDLDEYAFGALEAGASGFLLKDAQPSVLASAIRAVASGDAIVSPRVTRRLIEIARPALGRAEPPALQSLTAREREVLTLIGEGLSNTEICARLFLSESTVKTHVGRVLAKLGLRDRVHAVILAYEAGLVSAGGP